MNQHLLALLANAWLICQTHLVTTAPKPTYQAGFSECAVLVPAYDRLAEGKDHSADVVERAQDLRAVHKAQEAWSAFKKEASRDAKFAAHETNNDLRKNP